MKQLDLQKIRAQLDQLDQQLVSLFEERMSICKDVAEYKISVGKAVYDEEREKQKLIAVREMVHSDFNKKGVEELFSQIMTISRRLQYQILSEHGAGLELGFTSVKELQTTGSRVVYQGVEGAYSHSAALLYFGNQVDAFHVPRWEEAMEMVERGEADYAVLPLENSSAGAVSDNYDNLIKHQNFIVAEIFLPVNHALLGLPGAKLEDIKTVFSHPQALMQCSQFLNSCKNFNQISVENTAVAAQKVTSDQDKTQAAVASEIAGQLYGLQVLKAPINYNKDNTTRFVVLAKDPIYQKDAKKVSVCFELPHESGSLYNILGNFIYNGVNLRMIESRPISGRNWEYRFFADLEGNLSDAGIQNALLGVRSEASSLRILGNY